MKEWLFYFLEWARKWLFYGSELAEPVYIHYVKCESQFFEDVIEGYKPFELRKNDRNYEPGDDIVLREYDKDKQELTGREHRVTITYMLEGYPGIEPGYCILGIQNY